MTFFCGNRKTYPKIHMNTVPPYCAGILCIPGGQAGNLSNVYTASLAFIVYSVL